MHFIEDLFGVSPDNGSGFLEFLLFLVPVIVLAAVYAWRAARGGGLVRPRNSGAPR
jgi:hypothetical protein